MDELKDTIQLLEAEQAVKLQLLKENFRKTYESLHPAKLLKNTLKDISTSPYLANNLLSAGVGLAAGYASKKALIGGSSNVLRRFLGDILQLGVTNIIAQSPKTIRFLGRYISQRIFHKEE